MHLSQVKRAVTLADAAAFVKRRRALREAGFGRAFYSQEKEDLLFEQCPMAEIHILDLHCAAREVLPYMLHYICLCTCLYICCPIYAAGIVSFLNMILTRKTRRGSATFMAPGTRGHVACIIPARGDMLLAWHQARGDMLLASSRQGRGHVACRASTRHRVAPCCSLTANVLHRAAACCT
jgi:hypothetical protein